MTVKVQDNRRQVSPVIAIINVKTVVNTVQYLCLPTYLGIIVTSLHGILHSGKPQCKPRYDAAKTANNQSDLIP